MFEEKGKKSTRDKLSRLDLQLNSFVYAPTRELLMLLYELGTDNDAYITTSDLARMFPDSTLELISAKLAKLLNRGLILSRIESSVHSGRPGRAYRFDYSNPMLVELAQFSLRYGFYIPRSIRALGGEDV